MEKENKPVLKLPHVFYDPRSIAAAAAAFGRTAGIILKKKKNHTEISVAGGSENDLAYEFANYALFLTIQSK